MTLEPMAPIGVPSLGPCRPRPPRSVAQPVPGAEDPPDDGEGHREKYRGHAEAHSDSDVGVGLSLAMTTGFLAAALAVVAWIFKTGYRLRT